MINEQNVRQPDYKGDGIAIWKKTDKNGKIYLSAKVLGCYLNAFKNEPRQQNIDVENI